MDSLCTIGRRRPHAQRLSRTGRCGVPHQQPPEHTVLWVRLPQGEDSSNSPELASSKDRTKLGVLVSTWGILWRPLRLQFGSGTDLLCALFRLHNSLQNEKVTLVHLTDRDEESGRGHPPLSDVKTPSDDWQTEAPILPAALREVLVQLKQWRPPYNIQRHSGSTQQG